MITTLNTVTIRNLFWLYILNIPGWKIMMRHKCRSSHGRKVWSNSIFLIWKYATRSCCAKSTTSKHDEDIWDKVTRHWYGLVTCYGFVMVSVVIVSVLFLCLPRLARRAGTGLSRGVRGYATFVMFGAQTDCFTEMQCRWCSEDTCTWRSVVGSNSTWLM